jgi:uncharacterized protein YjdB/transglutaminase-like putative cysteine protease
MMKKCSLTLAIVLLFAGCGNLLVPPATKTVSCTVKWVVGSLNARTILPASNPVPTSYDVTLHSDTSGDTTKTDITGSSWAISSLLPQVYTVTVIGKDSGGHAIVQGTGTIDLSVAVPINPTITLNYITSGTGTGQIHLTLDFSAVSDPVTSVTLTMVDPSGTISSPALSSGNTIYAATSAAVGSYKIFIQARTAAKTALKNETLLVIQNVDTAATISFAASDFDASYVQVTSLVLDKSTSTLAIGAQETLTATLNAGVSNPLLQWTSSAPSVASVDQNGIVSALAQGGATITATSVDKPALSATCVYTVPADVAAGFSEGFESGGTSAQPWVLSKVSSYAVNPAVASDNVASGSYSMKFTSANMYSGGRTRASLQATVQKESLLSFKVKTDIGTTVSTAFIFSMDGTALGTYNGLDGSWSLKSFTIPAGTHTFLWSLEKDSNSYYSTKTNAVWLDDIDLTEKVPVTLASIGEGFESGNFSAYRWAPAGDASPTITSAYSYSGTKAAVFATRGLASGQSSTLSLDIKPTLSSVLSFWVKTDIGTDVSTSFQFLLDGTKVGEWNGLDQPWAQVTVPVTAGLHSLKWQAVKNSGSYYPSSTNSVYLDSVSLVPDRTASVSLSPKGNLDFYSGDSGQKFTAKALRSDGSTKTDTTFAYSVVTVGGGRGSIGSDGSFTPTAVGTCMVKAMSSDGVAEYSQLITVHPTADKYGPLTYGGTFYQGKSTAGSGNPLTRSTATISVTGPTAANFDADGFFTLKGSVAKPSVYNYAWVTVAKDSNPETECTSYFVRSTFATRLWLRFGSGAYTIKVYELATFAPDLGGEGDYNAWSYYPQAAYTFHVNNTRDESGVFLYPSDAIQSDDFRVSNIANDLTYGITDAQAKIKAIHDYVVKLIYYDNDSLADGQRKKQDTLSVLNNGTGVCEGYTSLANALLRAVGIRAKCVSGQGGGGPHAWTNVLLDGTWLFMDCTWDDPYPQGDYSVRYKYFLLTSMTGIADDHKPEDDRAGRGLVVAVKAPSWRGRPNGWY